MNQPITRIAILLMIGVTALASHALADGAVLPLGVLPQPAPQTLTVNVWTDKSTYTVGETLRIFFSVSQAAYVYIYDIQPDGVVRLIFPNAYSQANYVAAGTHALPNGLYQFTVVPPLGTEKLQIFASPVNLGLAPPYFGEPFPMAGSDPQSATREIQVQIQGIVPVPQWATAWTSFLITQPTYAYSPPTYTYPPTYPCPPAYGCPYPPFFGYPGGTWYYQDGQWYPGVPGSGWYWYFGPDGRWYLRIVFRFTWGN